MLIQSHEEHSFPGRERQDHLSLSLYRRTPSDQIYQLHWIGCKLQFLRTIAKSPPHVENYASFLSNVAEQAIFTIAIYR